MTMQFCGREVELKTLQDRWRLASDVDNPKPQVVVISGGRGIGKTRLAIEFYRWLSEHVNTVEETGYWSDAIEIVGKNQEVNPDPHSCNFKVPIPYLWFGLRAGDVGAENGVSGDAIATYDKCLVPHLVALLVRAKMKNRVWAFGQAWLNVGLDLTSSVFQVDNIISIGKGLFNTAQILHGALNDAEPNRIMRRPISRAEAVLSDMEKVFNPKVMTFARTPGVILIDDAQFAKDDEGLLHFVERLLHTAVTQQWPVTIVVTHWDRELSPELMPTERSFAGILHHIRDQTPKNKGPVAGLPGGYLKDHNFERIDLNPVEDLSTTLTSQLDGLSDEQVCKILDRAGGNPRFLEQIILLTHQHRSYFEGDDRSKALTEIGLGMLLTKAVDIESVVFERLMDMPDIVKEAISFASHQGVRFANSIANEIAQEITGKSCKEGLAKAEDPFSIVINTAKRTDQIGEFLERHFQKVALGLSGELTTISNGRSQIKNALKSILKTRLNSDTFDQDYGEDDRFLTLGLTANLFERSSDPEERSIARQALGKLAELELSRFSLEAATSIYERLLAIEPTGTYSEWKGRIATWDVLVKMYLNLKWVAKAARALKKIIWEATAFIPDGYHNIFIFATDNDAARERFNHWKQEHSDCPPELYLHIVRMVMPALLNLSELARARPDLTINEGDDSLGETPFLVRSEPRLGDGSKDETEPSIPEHIVQANFLQERAYVLNGILGVGEVEKVHFKLLEDLAYTNRDDDLPTSEAFLLRALQLNENLSDELKQIATLGNLGSITAQQGNLEASEKYLDQARILIEAILSEETFRVDLLVDEKKGDSSTINSSKIGAIDVPLRYSEEFDKNSVAVTDKVFTLKMYAADIYGNIAGNARQNGNLEAAKAGFARTLLLRKEINDKFARK